MTDPIDLDAARKKKAKLPPKPTGDRPSVPITTREHEVTTQSLAIVSRHIEIYQRGGMLVHPVRDTRPTSNLSRPAGAAYISELQAARLREMLAETCYFTKPNKQGEFVPSHVPDWLVKQVSARKQWGDIRPLEAISETPVLRADGSVLDVAGYDAPTGVLFLPNRAFPRCSARPTLEDAQAAITELLDPFVDFPFCEPYHQAAVLAGILTPLARFAFAGPSPLVLITKNVRGAGGSLLADAISIAATGRGMARMTQAGDEDEERKRILSIAMAGDRMVLIDNVDHPLGGAALDAALTGTEWRDRVLGRSEMVTAPLLATWFATGNNPTILGDTIRRVLPIRIVSRDEKPEERTGFRYDPLERHMVTQHPNLVSAALTVLRAHAIAGRPNMGLKPWGSFEGWSSVVRAALVWAGQVDPAIGREELTEGADEQALALRTLFTNWRHVDYSGGGISAQRILETISEGGDGEIAEALRMAVLQLAPGKGDSMPSAVSLGKRLAHHVGRVVNGMSLGSSTSRTNVKIWRVNGINTAGSAGDAGG